MSVTVSQIFARARWLADQEDFTARHTDAALTIEFNASMREMRARLFAARSPAVLDTVTFNTTAGASTGFAGTVLAPGLSAGSAIAGVSELKATIDGVWRILDQVQQSAEADWQLGAAATSAGSPEAFVILDYDSANCGLELMVLPACDKVYSVALTYMPQWTDATTSTAIQNDIPLVEWLVHDLARKMAIRDNDADRFSAKCDALAAEILQHHRRLRGGAPVAVRPILPPGARRPWRFED